MQKKMNAPVGVQPDVCDRFTETPDTSVQKLIEYRIAHFAARSEAARYVTNTPAQVQFRFANPVLCLLRTGQKIITIADFPPLVLNPGDLLYVPSGLEFNIDLAGAHPGAPIICDCLEVEASHLDMLLSRFNAYGANRTDGTIATLSWGVPQHILDKDAQVLGLEAVFTMFRERRDVFSDLLIETAIDMALLRLLQRCASTMLDFRDSAEDDGVSTAVQLINRQLDHHLSTSELAAKANLSESTLRRRFQQRLGASPTRYANRLRVQKLKVMLRETNLPLKEISYRLGFSDVSHMSRVFRAETGGSPALYRAKQRRDHDLGD
ncbi:AraC family transcriptional regulator [Thioclava sp. SK-1]|uniref:helix-turn-helix domain-containing protein n=1 Tax=Thioclava sp. SK-1 TaxID=1889770 RepID=UPI00159F17CF|nr:AraC family transcriptional regulator [Thioclava sp. SK-1]